MFAPASGLKSRQSRGCPHADVLWSECVVNSSDCARENLGLRFRSAIAGPEQMLVNEFLQAVKARLSSEQRLSVFVQPAIETGFPDLVAVVWRYDIAQKWALERERLRQSDLRLLHLLATHGAIDFPFLREAFHRGLHGMLSRLEEADLITVGSSKCNARPLSKLFAVQHIIAVEAKVSATQRALEQAGANTWFSSESYALLPKACTGDRLKDIAAGLGVGVIGLEQEHATKVYGASLRTVPLSYGSWLFNEWTWRIARMHGTI